MPNLIATQVIEIKDEATRPTKRNIKFLENIEKKLTKVGKTANKSSVESKGFFGTMASGLKQVAALALPYIGVKSIFGYLIEKSKNLVSMQNILHATNEEMAALGNTIARVSKNSTKSMSEMFEGAFALSRRFRDVNIVKESIEHVKNIADSTKQGMLISSQIYGDLYGIFSDEIKTGKITFQTLADEVAYSFEKTKGDLSDLQYFFQNSTDAIKNYGVSFQDSTAIYAVGLEKMGVPGNILGTKFKTLLNLFGDIDKRRKLGAKLGIDSKELDIRTKGVLPVLDKLKSKLDLLKPNEKDRILQSIFSSDQASTIISFALITDEMKKYRDAQEKIGFAQHASNNVLQSTYGRYQQLINSLMSLGEAFKHSEGNLAGILHFLTGIVETVKILIGLLDIMSIGGETGGVNDQVKKIKALTQLKDDAKSFFAPSVKTLTKEDFNPKDKELFKATNELFGFKKKDRNENISTNTNNNISLKIELDTKDKNILTKVQEKNDNQNARISVAQRNFSNF